MDLGRWGRGVLLGIVCCAVGVAACSSSEGGPSGPPKCFPGQKFCSGSCVEISPGYGCGAESCDACDIPGAKSICGSAGECVMSSCSAGNYDCDGNATNGCEVAGSLDNCGGCGLKCPLSAAHATQSKCSDRCYFECEMGYVDADGDVNNGCEKLRLFTTEPRCPTNAPADESSCEQEHWGSTCHYSHPAVTCTATIDCVIPLSVSQLPYWKLLSPPCP